MIRRDDSKQKKSTEIRLSNAYRGAEANARREDEMRIPALAKEYSGWDVYNNEAKKIDFELVKDWTSSLNFLLLFAAIFAAVLTSFVIESKKHLEQDPTSVMVDVMIFLANNVGNQRDTYKPVEFQPQFTDIIVNCLFYASLSASLIAALASVVALQWVADYDAAITRGGSSPEDRAKRRQFRYAGVVTWRMNEIISALPLILYFSVILFFVGLFIWMWNIHPIVGAVVGVGAALAVLFYGISTLVSVIFVSAPFRTPFSQWIYFSFRPFFSILYRVWSAIHKATLPSWLEKQHFLYTIAHKREDQIVKESPGLGKEALLWLANQLSISQESSYRLLLLAGEISKLPSEHMPSFSLTEASWYDIFDLLGWGYLAPTQEVVDGEDIQGMAILQRCFMIPAVQELVSPSPEIPYIANLQDINYWSQYCETGAGIPWSVKYGSPNRLFLLLRDTPPPSGTSPQELELAIRLAQWRNSSIKLPQVWDTVFLLEDSLSPDFLNSCVAMFSNFCALQNWYRWFPEHSEMFHSTMKTVLRIASTRDDFTPHTIVSLVQAYECLRVGYGDAWKVPGTRIIRSILYGQAIQTSIEENTEHNIIPYLLARQLHSYPLPERPRRIEELLAVLWLRPSHSTPRNWNDLVERDGGINLPRRSDMVSWIKGADQIPHILEILSHLASAQSQITIIGPLWRATGPGQVNDPHFIEALQAFDNLMSQDCTPEDHLTMISLICQDLEFSSPPNFEGYFTPSRLAILTQIVDPCLQTIANCARGTAYMTLVTASESYNEQRTKSWDRIAKYLLKKHPMTSDPSILQLQASIWPMHHGQRELYQNALEVPEMFAYLQRLFDCHIACPTCIDGPGHLLLHILDAALPCSYPKELRRHTSLSSQSSPLFIILSAWYTGDQIYLDKLFDRANGNSLRLLNGSLDQIKTSQYHMLVLLWNTTYCLRTKGIRQADLTHVLLGIQKALRLENEPESIPILPLLASNILDLRDKVVGRFAQREAISKKAVMTSQAILSNLTSRKVHGRCNGKNMSCARATRNVSPAIGWHPPYFE